MDYKKIVFLSYESIDESSKIFQKLKKEKLSWFFSTNKSHFILIEKKIFQSYDKGYLDLFKGWFLSSRLVIKGDKTDEENTWNQIGDSFI